MCDAVDRHTAFIADSHTTERRSRLRADRSAKPLHSLIENCRCHARLGRDYTKLAVEGDLYARIAHAFASMRDGANAVAAIAGDRDRIMSVRMRAVPSEVVIPNPS